MSFLFSRLPRASCSFSTATRALSTTPIARTPIIPQPRGPYTTPADFLTALGRSADTKLKVETWEELFSLKTKQMEAMGIGPRDRKYFAWGLEKFRQGYDPKKYAREAKPQKMFRRWGPRVQHGKRVRGALRPGESYAPGFKAKACT